MTIHDVGEAEQELFLAMEFVEGAPLSTMDNEALRWRRVISIYRQAVAGLSAAHDVGIVHRDFEPDNALLGTDGRVRVLDFGLARAGMSACDDCDEAVATRSRRYPPEHGSGAAPRRRRRCSDQPVLFLRLTVGGRLRRARISAGESR